MFGYAHLVLLDCNIDMSTLKLPENYKWQDSEFVKGISVPEKYDENIEWMLKKTAQVLDKDEWITKMLWQPQHQTGWFAKASKWLEECVRMDGAKVVGRVSVFRVWEASSILTVNSDKGYYFLKAVCAGSNELVKTVTISKLFENLTVDVMGVCEELGSFVTREIGVYDSKRAEKMDKSAVFA